VWVMSLRLTVTHAKSLTPPPQPHFHITPTGKKMMQSFALLLLLLPLVSLFLPSPTFTRNSVNFGLFSYQEPYYEDYDGEPPRYQEQEPYYEEQQQPYYEEQQQPYYEDQQQPRYINDYKEKPQGLVLGDDLDNQMNALKSKFPTSEADYLALA